MIERSIPPPILNPEAKPFFDGAAEGRLLIKHCSACGQYHHFPRSLCPFCFSDRTEWREAKGTGSIYSFSVLRRAVPPYCIAYVTLDERVSIFTNIVDCDFDAIRIGQRVRVVFKRSGEGASLPMFALQT
ncbi:MAG: OB-fold domain-containing protein [Burkholderiaceae bacterium]|nr:OB-fold domain-containing protein [Burkholderiaceae bacterium]